MEKKSVVSSGKQRKDNPLMITWKCIKECMTSCRKKTHEPFYVAYDEIDDVIIPQEVHFESMFENSFFVKATEFQKKAWDKIFVSFRFCQKTLRSEIILTGRNYNSTGCVIFSKEMKFQAPDIPLIGGVWSNHVAMRMLAGQEMLSAMLDTTTKALQYNQLYHIGIAEQSTKIVKVDRCFYAPFLYTLEKPDFFTNLSEKQYMPFLKDNYPEAYTQVLQLQTANQYWRYYHDVDVEANIRISALQ